VWVGPYATARGTTTSTVADVERVEYRGAERRGVPFCGRDGDRGDSSTSTS
jgi:hypothetical protein